MTEEEQYWKDNYEKAMIELVDFNEIYGKGKGEEKAAAKKTDGSKTKKYSRYS